MKIRIVYAVDATGNGPDLTRIGQVEDHDPDYARLLIGEGAAVAVDDEPAPKPKK